MSKKYMEFLNTIPLENDKNKCDVQYIQGCKYSIVHEDDRAYYTKYNNDEKIGILKEYEGLFYVVKNIVGTPN